MRLKTALACAAAACLTGAAPPAALAASFTLKPTNLEGVFEVSAPPANFDYVHATDAQLADYAVPPRPNPSHDRAGYAVWKRAMLMRSTRVGGPLKMMDGFAGHATGFSRFTPQRQYGNAQTVFTFNNWSGYIERLTNVTAYDPKASFTSVNANLYVPAARYVGSCGAGRQAVLTWAGIDGAFSPDVLQAGSGTETYCDGTSASFSWFEWYPNIITTVPALVVSPNDEVYVHVWATSATTAYAYVQNYRTNKSFQVSVPVPSGTRLVGDTAEFITEAEGFQGSPLTLSSYNTLQFPYVGSQTGSGTTYNLNSSITFPVYMKQNNKIVSVSAKTGATSFYTSYQ